ncbi:MAG TPA: hypothetical protein VEI97_07800, partial [bacterium]|nr:hypothetical protein [bacterium]
MPAPLRLIPAALCCVLVVAGCGGVPRNPTEPTFPNRGTPQTGQPGGDTGGGPVSPDQDPGLAGATSPQDFRMRAHAALLQGNLITGANGYTKYVELENTNPEAAFGLAVTTLLRDLDLFAGFTANELPLTFFNTPLAVSPTLVPQPLAAEDSYFWRLLALGVDSQPPLNPAKEVADFLAEAGGTPPPAPQPAQAQPGTPAQPVPGPRLSPGAIRPGGERPKEGSPSSPSRGKSGGGDAKGGSASASVAAPRGGQAATGITLPGTNRAIPALPAQRSLEPVAERSGQQEAVVAAGDEKGEDTTAGREQRTGGTQPGAQSVPGSTPPGNDPAQILANAEYQKLSSDLFASELVPAAQRYLGQRAGLWFSWRGRNERVNRLRATLDTLITAMDRSGEEVEDGFQVTLPLQLGAQKKAYEVTFQQEDYALLLQHLKLYKWLIDYRGMYTTAGNWNFLVPLKDTDSDGVLSPAEYYPAAPFGTLTEAAKQENLAPLRGSLGTILRDLGEAQKAYKDSDRYRTTEKNFIVPRNVDNNLDRLMLDENNRVLGVSLALPEDDGKVNLDYGNPSTEVAVNYGPLFDGTLDDVRSILPPVSADTHVVQPAPAGPEGEGAAARVLPASLSWEALLTRSVDVQGLILKGGTPANKA